MVDTLCAVAGYLKPVEGPKTLVLVSGQLPGGFGQVAVSQWFAKCAAEARMKLYAIRHLTVPADAQSGDRQQRRAPTIHCRRFTSSRVCRAARCSTASPARRACSSASTARAARATCSASSLPRACRATSPSR